MATDGRNILVVEVDQEEYEPIASVLKRINFDVDRFPTASGALELVSAVPFSAMILKYPLERLRLEEFISQAKKDGSASRQAAVAVLADDGHEDEARAYLDSGIDLVIANEEQADDREAKLCQLLGIMPRQAVRVLVRLEVTVEDDKKESFIAQTRDLSESGMFIATSKLYPVGSRAHIVFTLPDGQAPVAVEIEVTRHGVSGKDSARGMGFKFIDISNEDNERLNACLGSAE